MTNNEIFASFDNHCHKVIADNVGIEPEQVKAVIQEWESTWRAK